MSEAMRNESKSKALAKEVAIAASQSLKEKEYWTNKLSGEWAVCRFPYDRRIVVPGEPRIESFRFQLTGDLFSRLMAVSKGSDPKLHMILTTGTAALLEKYTGTKDIILGTSIDKQDSDRELINTILPLRITIPLAEPGESCTFKSLLLRVRETVNEAIEHQNYPIEVRVYDGLKVSSVEECS